jgi:hypothetical protein
MIHTVRRIRWLSWGLVLIYVVSGGVATVSADDSRTQADLYRQNILYYDISTCNGAGGTTTPPGTLPSLVPEPYNGAFTQGGNNHKVSPALVAAIFTEENFTGIDPSKIAARWAQFPSQHPNPNSGWRYSKIPPSEVWPDGEVGAGGPFQFEPSTWKGLGANYPYTPAARDNIVTAADAAANYLAGNGATVDKQPATWNNAILRYNDAQWYADAVMVYYRFYTTGSTSSTAPTTAPAPGGTVDS